MVFKFNFCSHGEKRHLHLFIFTLKNGMKKPRKPWRRLGFRDLHLFRAQTLVAGVGLARKDNANISLLPLPHRAARVAPREQKRKHPTWGCFLFCVILTK